MGLHSGKGFRSESGIAIPAPVARAVSAGRAVGLSMLLMLFCLKGCSGGGGSQPGGAAVSSLSLASQLTDETNWRILSTYDQKDAAGTPTYSAAFKSSAWAGRSRSGSITDGLSKLLIPEALAYQRGNRIYTASGLVSEMLTQLYADENLVAAGNNMAGFSHIAVSDLLNARGKICNYRGRDSRDALQRFGLSGFAKGTADGRVYAWYGRDIVDVVDKNVVFADAPDFTHGSFGCTPKDRFVSDENGDFWIGTSNLEADGSIYNSGERANGLYRISAAFSGIETLDAGLAVWNIFKDSAGVLWIGSQQGIHRRPPGGSPLLVYNSTATGLYPEQILEFRGQVHVVLKNFFHNPQVVPADRSFELYRWNSGSSLFLPVCAIDADPNLNEMNAYVFDDTLRVFNSGSAFPYVYDPDTETVSRSADPLGDIGLQRHVVVGGTLYSVGSGLGLSVHNLQGNGQTLNLLPAATAEGLITDLTYSLYLDRDNRLLIGPEASAFNRYDRDQFEIYELPHESPIAGFFEHEGKTRVVSCCNVSRLHNGDLSRVHFFPTNGERIYFDRGRLWAFPNWSTWGFGSLALLDMDTGSIKAMKDYQGNDYWNASETWVLDRGYHFRDIIAVPGEEAVLIAVGEENDVGAMPFVLKYSYAANTFTRVYLPDAASDGIRAFAAVGQTIYGAARQKLYAYEAGVWREFGSLAIGNDLRGMKAANRHLFIVSGWNSSGAGLTGGMEVVDLRAKTSAYFDSSSIPIPADPIFAIEIEGFSSDRFRLWLGGPNGVAYCTLVLEE